MRLPDHFRRVILLALTMVLLGFAVSYAQDNYSFQVHNTTKNTITKVLVSEDGKRYGNFDIGKGIPPGKTVTLVWDKSTNKQSCQQYFKAVFDNGEESEAVKFDFCEPGLVLEF